MDSTRNLRDALDEADPGTQQAAQASRYMNPNEALRGCASCSHCHTPPAPGCKLKHCGRCRLDSYCNSTCAKAAWPKHKILCERLIKEREAQEVARAAYDKVHGGRVSHLSSRGAMEWFSAVPGFNNQVALLAWQHRGESPIIHVFANRSDAAGRALTIRIEPRSSWEGNAEYTTHQRHFDQSSFHPNKQYMIQMELEQENQSMTSTSVRFFNEVVRAAEIVEALTTATKAEDLADAFAWIEENRDGRAQKSLHFLRYRAAMLTSGSDIDVGAAHLNVASSGVPAPSRALNNEAAYLIIRGLDLQFAVRLTGPVGASHLNGKEGVIYAQVGGNVRWTVRLGDGKRVNVKAANFVHVCGNYKRMHFPNV